MNTVRKMTLVLVMVALAAGLVMPAFAQAEPVLPLGSDCAAVVVTQEQINARLSKLPSRIIKDAKVTLGDGQVTVAFTMTPRQGGKRGQSSAQTIAPTQQNIIAILIGLVKNGRVEWTVKSLTVNGQPATAEQTERIGKLANRLAGFRFGRQRGCSLTTMTITPQSISFNFTKMNV
jgi:hypothetical protein